MIVAELLLTGCISSRQSTGVNSQGEETSGTTSSPSHAPNVQGSETYQLESHCFFRLVDLHDIGTLVNDVPTDFPLLASEEIPGLALLILIEGQQWDRVEELGLNTFLGWIFRLGVTAFARRNL